MFNFTQFLTAANDAAAQAYGCVPVAADPSAANAAAAAGDEAAAAGCTAGSLLLMVIVYGGLFLLLYLILIRPQNKKRKQEEEMRNSVAVGDEITTIGGICGRVVSVKDDDSYIIETGAEKNKIKIMRWAILQNNTIKEAVPEDDAAAKKGFFAKLFKK